MGKIKKMKKEIMMMKREIERLKNEKEDKKRIVIEGFVRKDKIRS